nr:hypothetical protein [Planctomycetota bacterium]
MSFRHNSTAILLCVVFSIFASCASSDHPVATSKQYPVNESSDSLPNDGNIEVGDIDFDELQVMVSDFPERALSDLDEWLAGYDSPRLHLLFGQASLNLLEQRQASGKLGPGLAADLFSDADAAFAKSLVNFDTHNASLRGMARSFCRQGQFVPAWSSALLWHSAEQHNFNLNDQLLFAEIGLGRVIAEQKKQAAETPAAHLAAEAFEAAIELGAPHSTRISLSDLHAWQQRPAAAAVELAAAISAAPDDPTAYQRLKSLCLDNRNLHTATLKQLCFELSDSASALWYYGEALYLQARDARAAADFIKGMSALDNAERAFEQAAILNEDFAQSCHDWISILKTLRAWLLRDDQRIDDAIASVLDVIEFNPIALQQPLLEESLPNV